MITKIYYSTSEVAELFGVHPETIRVWDGFLSSSSRKRVALKVKRNRHNERRFMQADIDKLKRFRII